MKRFRKLFHALVVLAGFAAFTVLGSDSNKPTPGPMPTVSWDRTFLTPGTISYDPEEQLLSLSWSFAPEAAASTLHIQVRPKDDSEDWTTLFVGNIRGFAALNGDINFGAWYASIAVDEKVYVWVEYVAPPVVHTNGVYHLSGVYHAMDTDEPKYVAPTIDVKFVGDDDGQSSRNWKAYGKKGEVDHE